MPQIDHFADLDRQAMAAHSRAKNVEAMSREFGEIPKGLRRGICQVTGIDLTKSQKGNTMAVVNFMVLTDSSGEQVTTKYKGARFSQYYSFVIGGRRSIDEIIESFYSDLKLLGFTEEVESSTRPSDVIRKIQERVKTETCFCAISTSSSRLRDDGSPFVTIGKPPTEEELRNASVLNNSAPFSNEEAKKPSSNKKKRTPSKPVDGGQKGVGSRVSVRIEDTDYHGEITGEPNDEEWEITFDDGDVMNILRSDPDLQYV